MISPSDASASDDPLDVATNREAGTDARRVDVPQEAREEAFTLC